MQAGICIRRVMPATMEQAGWIHSESWKQAHKDFCSAAFVALHTPQRQRAYLQAEAAKGAQLYMLWDGKPVGIVSVQGNLIANLYVLPQEQNKGYGTKLLAFAIGRCEGTPTLWLLSTNEGAMRLYARHGFRPTGNTVQHGGGVHELELCLRRDSHVGVVGPTI